MGIFRLQVNGVRFCPDCLVVTVFRSRAYSFTGVSTLDFYCFFCFFLNFFTYTETTSDNLVFIVAPVQ